MNKLEFNNILINYVKDNCITPVDFTRTVTSKWFKDRGLYNVLKRLYKGSPYLACIEAFGLEGVVKSCDCKTMYKGKWSDENIRWVLKNLFEEVYCWDKKDICENFSIKWLDRVNLHSLRHNRKCIDLLNIVYPGEFDELYLKYKSADYWNHKENRLRAVKLDMKNNNITDYNDLRAKHFKIPYLRGAMLWYNDSTVALKEDLFT